MEPSCLQRHSGTALHIYIYIYIICTHIYRRHIGIIVSTSSHTRRTVCQEGGWILRRRTVALVHFAATVCRHGAARHGTTQHGTASLGAPCPTAPPCQPAGPPPGCRATGPTTGDTSHHACIQCGGATQPLSKWDNQPNE